MTLQKISTLLQTFTLVINLRPANCYISHSRSKRSNCHDQPTASYKRITHRLLPGLYAQPPADNEANHDKKELSKKKSILDIATDNIEGAVRAVGLGDDDYKFGDLTKKAVSEVTGATEQQIRTVTGNDGYQFGDYTKNITEVAVAELTSTTDKLLFESDSALTKFLLEYYQKIPSDTFRRFVQECSKSFNENNSDSDSSAMIVTLQLLAFVGLTLNFVLNVCTSLSVIMAWVYSCWCNKGASPLQSATLWGHFLNVQSTLRLFVGPMMLPIQCVATFFLCVKYRDMVMTIEQKLLLPCLGNSNKPTTLSRLIALIGSWIFVNGVAVSAFTCLGCYTFGGVAIRLFQRSVL